MKYASLLRAHGLKATPARLAILEILDRHEHPDVDELFSEIKQKLSCVSQATVYKNIAAMLKSGVIVELAVPNERAKYDIYAQEHIHLICEKCHKIYDVDCIKSGLDAYSAELCKRVSEFGELGNVYVQGNIKTCRSCCDA